MSEAAAESYGKKEKVAVNSYLFSLLCNRTKNSKKKSNKITKIFKSVQPRPKIRRLNKEGCVAEYNVGHFSFSGDALPQAKKITNIFKPRLNQ